MINLRKFLHAVIFVLITLLLIAAISLWMHTNAGLNVSMATSAPSTHVAAVVADGVRTFSSTTG